MRRTQIPFLFAIAFLAVVYVTIANSSQVPWVENAAGPTKELPCPRSSAMDWIVQNKTVRDPACIDQWGESAPRRWYVGRVVQYEGEDGPYYLFEGWRPLPLENCTKTNLDEGQQFPDKAMLYIPKLARLFPFSDPEACQTVTRKPVTSKLIAELNRRSMGFQARPTRSTLHRDFPENTGKMPVNTHGLEAHATAVTPSPLPSRSPSPRISVR